MRIWFAVSGHGYGHFVQTAALLNALAARQPDLTVHVAGNVPEELVRRWLRVPFSLGEPHGDVRLVQRGPLQVELEATRELLHGLHTGWAQHLDECARALEAWRPDVVLSNVPYLPVAAAAACGVPSLLVSSFSWDRIIADYFSLADPEVRGWWQQARESYAIAAGAIGLTPWAFDDRLCADVRRVEPVVEPMVRQSDVLRERLGLTNERPLVLVTMGGIADRDVPLAALLEERRVNWLVPGTVDHAPHVRAMERAGEVPFQQVAASADAIVGKLGYNTAVQSAACGTPMLYVRRPRFPDEIDLAAWLHHYHVVREISMETYYSGRGWYDELEALWALPRPEAPPPNGLGEAVAILQEHLGRLCPQR